MSKRNWFDPPWEDIEIVLVDADTIRKAEQRIASCEGCCGDAAQVPSDHVLDGVTGFNPQRDGLCARAGRAVSAMR